jgi:general secretion pathway protein K
MFTQKGLALVAVAAVTAFIGVATAEFSYNTNIDFAQAANARDDMRAYFLARSGMNLSRLVIKVQKDVFDKYRKYLGDVQLADYLPMLTGVFGGSKEEVAAFAEALGGIQGDQIKGLGLPEGEFDIQVTTDDGKINMNCARSSSNQAKQLELMLTAMVMPQGYDRIFEERDGDGQFTDRPTFIRALMDWIDPDTAAYGSNGQPEDYGYESRPEPYKAKDNYIDSVDELQLVRGMDEKRWALFGPAFTVYGGCKVNIAAANDLNVLMAIIYQAAKDPQDPVLRDLPKLWQLAAVVAQARGFGIMFNDLNEFADFVKDPAAALGDLAGKDQQNGGSAATTNPWQNVQGVELDRAKLALVARAGGRRTYRVTTTSKIGKVEKKIVGVWDTDVVNQNARDPAYAKGNWIYWREE